MEKDKANGLTMGQRIRQARIAAGHKVGMRFAKLVDINQNLLYVYEKDKVRPGSENLLRIANACGVTPEWLWNGD